jgi:hypothetical protein
VYFHASYFEKMLDLPSLAPARFKLDTECYQWNRDWPRTWGLILQKCFELDGCITLHQITKYFKAYIRYEREVRKHDTAWIKGQLAHKRKGKDEEGMRECLSQPDSPEEPLLDDCQTNEGDVCPLSMVLIHRHAERAASTV